MPVELQGEIERITYTNEENWFTIAKLKVVNRRELVTVVGHFPPPAPGECIKVTGEWTTHPSYGQQFAVSSQAIILPPTVTGIEKYLGSGMIKGIGPVMAQRIVKRFGANTLDIIDNHPERLTDVEGIGNTRLDMIRKAWAAQKGIRDLLVFLQSQGVSTTHATKIFKQYGDRAATIIRQNPYRLATDIFGIGFLTADRIAEKLGFDRESGLRAQSGIVYVLQQLSTEGHTYYPYELLIKKAEDMLQASRPTLVNALATLAAQKQVVIEDGDATANSPHATDRPVYLATYYSCETSIARRLHTLMQSPTSLRPLNAGKALSWVQKRLAITLADRQRDAIAGTVSEKVLVITGGPGTGKTTIINAALMMFSRVEARVFLTAPTGRAAKRMTEATGFEAKTIHRLLEYSIREGGFQRNEYNPLDCHVLIIDEASMIDTVLMHHLLTAVPPEATLILVGDVNQLPPVGAGNVLKDIIASGMVPVVELTEIFRQASESRIIVNAHRVKQGLLPDMNSFGPDLGDFYFIEKDDPDEVLRLIIELARDRIPGRFGLDPLGDIQVITPMNKGEVGVDNLNQALQAALNPHGEEVRRAGNTFRCNDKVMQIRNNYEKDVFNGDIGRIVHIDGESHEVTVSFDGNPVVYDYNDLDELVPAYAITVHKSQGSEYPAVIITLLPQHFILLQRNLVYTALTRGKRLVVIVGSRRALSIGVRNAKTMQRYTALASRLQALTAGTSEHTK